MTAPTDPCSITWAQVMGAIKSLTDGVVSTYGIANRLRELGMTGEVCNAGECILSNYIRVRSGIEEVYVGPDEVSVQVDYQDVVIVPLPLVLSEFEHNFDMGLYPDLEDKGMFSEPCDATNVPGSQTHI